MRCVCRGDRKVGKARETSTHTHTHERARTHTNVAWGWGEKGDRLIAWPKTLARNGVVGRLFPEGDLGIRKSERGCMGPSVKRKQRNVAGEAGSEREELTMRRGGALAIKKCA